MTAVMTRETPWSPGMAWIKSLPLALGIPAVLWVILMLGAAAVEKENVGGTLAILWIYLAFAVPIHLLMYAVVGLPLFHLGKSDEIRWIWRLPIALVLGVLAGIVPSLIVASFLYGFDLMSFIAREWFWILGFYGLVTAVAAYRERPPDGEIPNTAT